MATDRFSRNFSNVIVQQQILKRINTPARLGLPVSVPAKLTSRVGDLPEKTKRIQTFTLRIESQAICTFAVGLNPMGEDYLKQLEIPDHVDPRFRYMLTPNSGDVDPQGRVFAGKN